MVLVVIRSLILYFMLVLVLRLMGKRQIGQLQPFELVILLILSELAAIPMENTGIPLAAGLVPIFTLLLAQVTLAYISLKNRKARNFLCGVPSVLIENGLIVEKELTRLRYNLDDLLEQLRIKNIFNIDDVEFAILETSGELSVIPKSQKRPATPEDLKISTSYEGPMIPLIVDGKVDLRNLNCINLDEKWLKNELARRKINNPSEVFFASLDSDGNLFVQKKSEGPDKVWCRL